jgi:hypothetical protein
VTKFSNPGGTLFVICFISLVRIALSSPTRAAHRVTLFVHPIHEKHVGVAVAA